MIKYNKNGNHTSDKIFDLLKKHNYDFYLKDMVEDLFDLRSNLLRSQILYFTEESLFRLKCEGIETRTILLES